MRVRTLSWVATLIGVVGTTLVTGMSVGAQEPAARANSAKKPAATLKTPWGDPDLQGVWNASGATPMERPAAFAGRDTLTDAEVKRLNGEDEANADRPPRPGDPGAYNDFWF